MDNVGMRLMKQHGQVEHFDYAVFVCSPSKVLPVKWIEPLLAKLHEWCCKRINIVMY